MLSGKALSASLTAGAEAVYIEDVFSTYLYTGNGSTQTITNNIDLSTNGGLVWLKHRQLASRNNFLFDTDRGIQKYIISNTTAAEVDGGSTYLTAFNTNGFAIGSETNINASGYPLVSWSFAKQEKFFDIVTYTGNGSDRSIDHNLNSVPGLIIVKSTSTASGWAVYHRSLSSGSYLTLNTTSAAVSDSTYFTTTAPTSTTFRVGTANATNANGQTYVAYLFAHDAGGFGASGTDNVISCGSFTSSGSGTATITLGYEPQWFLFKSSSAAGDWQIIDNMRGWSMDSQQILKPNSSAAEELNIRGPITPTGINITDAGAVSTTFIYIAIRRGPMKTPTSGTEVFTPLAYTGDQTGDRLLTATSPVDLAMIRTRSGGTIYASYYTGSRLQGAGMTTNTTSNEDQITNRYKLTSSTKSLQNKILLAPGGTDKELNVQDLLYSAYAFRRAPGFFDVVCYTGTGANRTVSHNLGVAPELMIVKRRETANAWAVYANNDNTDYLVLNTTAATVDDNTYWNDTSPTSSVFSVGTNNATNASGSTYVAYLFASLSGVSKVGSYTGTGTTLQVNCGFTNGSRFVLIKRTDSTGDWYVWDSARGIVSGNDPYLLLNSTAAEVTNTDYVDTYSSGFEISSTAPAAINANGGTFIFLAVA